MNDASVDFKSPMATKLPNPQTYHLLCAVPEAEEKFESGIIKAETTTWQEELLSLVLFVVKLGPDAYKNEKIFPSGPACKEGDFVIVRPNTGTRMVIHGKEFRLIVDEAVEATVQDPRGIKRPSR
jgi:co-chaperonin GroES (HSP10)